MKILLVNKFLYPNGGSETYIFKLGEQLIAMGHEVQYFGMDDPRNIVGNMCKSYSENMDFHNKGLAKLLYPFKIIYSTEARRKIRTVLDDFKPDIVHLNNFNFQLTPSIIYEVKKHHIPIVFTAHDYQLICPNHMCFDIQNDTPCEVCIEKGFGQCVTKKCIHESYVKSLLGTVEARIYKWLKTYRLIDLVICPSAFMQHMMDQNIDLKGRTIALHNFIDKEKSIPQERLQNQKYGLYFGRLEKEKGIETLLAACEDIPEMMMRYAGRGSFEDAIRNSSHSTLLGFLSKEEITKLVSGARFTVCPSIWYENGPFSVMESLRLGVPVIGSRIGGIPELVRDGENGLLFKPGDVKDLKEKLIQIWTDDELYNKLHEGCKGSEVMDIEQYTVQILNIYQKLCENDSFN